MQDVVHVYIKRAKYRVQRIYQKHLVLTTFKGQNEDDGTEDKIFSGFTKTAWLDSLKFVFQKGSNFVQSGDVDHAHDI